MPDVASPNRRHGGLSLMGQVGDAADSHHRARRTLRSGASGVLLDHDLSRWLAMGSAIVDLARLVCGHCAASNFCDARPKLEPLAARLVEAMDDQIDEAAWMVIDAQVRLESARAAE